MVTVMTECVSGATFKKTNDDLVRLLCMATSDPVSRTERQISW